MERKKIRLSLPESNNEVGYSDGKVVIKTNNTEYYFDSSEANDLSVKVINTLSNNIITTKQQSENSETVTQVSSSERGAL